MKITASSPTAPWKRLDRASLVQWLEAKADAETHDLGPVAKAIYEGLLTRVLDGQFDLPDQTRCRVCGRFTTTSHAHEKDGNTRAHEESAGVG